MTSIISELLADARRRLANAVFEPSTREANLLLAHLLDWTEAQLLARADQPLSESDVERFDDMLRRRLDGEPVAYILGRKEFYGRSFLVDGRVLIPRPETEHLVEAVLELDLPDRAHLLDLGTGSGCLACTLALELPTSHVFATDISPGALAVARHNLMRHRLSGRLHLMAGDLASALNLARFDVVASNPPYIGRSEADGLSSEITDFEPPRALFAEEDGMAVHRRLLSELEGLRPGSWLVLEIGAEQQEPLRSLASGSAFNLHEIRHDYAGRPRTALLQRR